MWKEILPFEEIIFEYYNGIAKITINRPRYRNAFTPLTVSEMSKAFNQATIASVNLANAMKVPMEQHQEAVMMEQEKQLQQDLPKLQSLNALASLEVSSKKLNKIINGDQA